MENIRYLLDVWVRFVNSFEMQTMSVVILGLTLIIIARYTMASLCLLREAKFQSELAISPIVVVTFDEAKDLFIVKNLGKGIAININVSSFYILLQDMNIVWRLEFGSLNLLEANGEKPLDYRAFENKSEILSNGKKLIYSHLAPSKYGAKDYEISIGYQNVLGHKYYTRITTGKSGVKIIEITKKRLLKWLAYKLRGFIWNKYIRIKVYFVRKFKYKLKK